MRGPAVRTIVIAAGGTGGHLFPAEALAAELLARGERIALMTDARSAAFDSAAFASAERFVLRGSGLSGRGAAARRRAARWRSPPARCRRAGCWRGCTPRAVVGFGGYPCVPPVLAALPCAVARPATVLHEQNAVLGRANRLLAPRADRARAVLRRHGAVPPRHAWRWSATRCGRRWRRWREAGYPPAEGGTRCACWCWAARSARASSPTWCPAPCCALPPELRAAAGGSAAVPAGGLARVREAYAAAGVPAELSPFFPDVAGRLATAHLVIARAGASTVAELACAGRPGDAGAAAARHRRPPDRQCPGARRRRRRLGDAASRSSPRRLLAAAPCRAARRPGRAGTPPPPPPRSLAQPDAARRLADLVLSLVRPPDRKVPR